MSATRDPDRRIRAFLAEGRSELPDRAYDEIRASIDRTRQRTVIGKWREPDMSTLARFATAAAAVAVVAIIGLDLLRGSDAGVAGTAPSASTSPTPSAVPVSPSPVGYSWPRDLAPGSYTTSLRWDPFYEFQFTIGEGWVSRDIGIIKGDRMALLFYFAENVVADTCTETLADPPIGGSTDDLAAALSKLVSVTSGPRSTAVGDRSGIYLEYSSGPNLPCPPGEFRLMRLEPPSCAGRCGPLGPPWIGVEFDGAPSEQHRMWILGVGRGRAIIDAVWTPDATADDLAELQAVIDSMRLDTPTATPPPQPVGS